MSGYPESTRACPKCGKATTAPGRFCTGCGTRLDPEQTPPSAQTVAPRGSGAERPATPSMHASPSGTVPPSRPPQPLPPPPQPLPPPPPPDTTHPRPPGTDTPLAPPRSLAAIAAAVALALLIGAGAAYLGGAFGSSHSRLHTSVTLGAHDAASTSSSTTTSTTTGTTETPAGTHAPTGPLGPSSTLRAYFRELGSGHEQTAFAMMSMTYREQNQSWLSEREEAQPQVNVVSVGSAGYSSGNAGVPVEFFARDKFTSHGSDTLCRRFTGTVTMVHVNGQWQYEPDTSKLRAAVVPSNDPGCPR
jgi:hypothetical protein